MAECKAVNGGLRMSNEWRQAAPELSATIRLLLLLSRIELNLVQRKRAAALCLEIEDWDAFAGVAADHFVAPLVLRHLSELPETPSTASAQKALMPVVRAMTFHILRLAALQRRFVEQHVAPLGCRFAVIKGRALAARYYADANLRYARDLDILLPVDRIPALITSAQQEGFRVYPERRFLNSGEARVLSRQAPVITLLGSDNIYIEVHAQLDKAGFLPDHRRMLKRCDQVLVDGIEIGMLNTIDHFVFICLHHTKHFWSRLNWVSDLDALANAPDFDEGKALALARSTGIERTIRASLAFYRACGSDDPMQVLHDDQEGSDLLRACLVILNGGAKREFEMRPDRLALDFNFEWQFPQGFQTKQRLRRLGAILRPSMRDYQMLGLPPSMYWAYYLIKPALVLKRRLVS